MDMRDLLRGVMSSTDTTQVELSRLSGVSQPRISQFLTGRVDMSERMLSHLLSCMGYQLEVVRRPVTPTLNRSETRSWRLHREISGRLSERQLREWLPTVTGNLNRLKTTTTGQPHQRNLERWQTMIEQKDLRGLRRVLTGLDRDSIEMREVSPMGGLLSQKERSQVLGLAS